MHTVHTAMAQAKRIVRFMRSASTPMGTAPKMPINAIANGRKPTAASETWNRSSMPLTAWASDRRSPLSRATVAASATSGPQPYRTARPNCCPPGAAVSDTVSQLFMVVDLEVLDLDHHGKQIAHVETGDRERAVVLRRLVDDVDALVLRLVRTRSLEHLVELLDAVHLHAEVVHPRPGHVRLVGDEEHELSVPVGHQHQALPVVGQLGELLPPEDVLIEGGDVGPAALVEGVGRKAHGHVVEPRMALLLRRGVGHDIPFKRRGRRAPCPPAQRWP